MSTSINKKRDIKYVERDFEGLKTQAVQFLKTYFPDSINDFNESSVGMLLTELMAYFADNINFYIDKKFNESFIETATESKNLFKHAKQLGYKAFGKSSAVGKVDTFIKVPAITKNEKIEPDMRYAGIIKKGAKLQSESGKYYETLDDVDFSNVNINDTSVVVVAERDATTKLPTFFALKVPDVEVKAGETKTTTFSIGSYKSFNKLTLPDDDVLEVLEVKDSSNNQYYEVDYLAQDTIFDGVKNNSSDLVDVPYVLKLKTVPYRFITEFDIEKNRMYLTFGSGDASTLDGDLIPNLGDLALPLYGKDTFTDFAVDPQNFLKTRTLGIAPTNTTLTIKYRVGGGLDTNAASNTVSKVAQFTFEVGDSSLSSTMVSDVGNSFSVMNNYPIVGGKDETSIDEIKQLISANFAAQNRIVTAEDFVVRSLSMPTRYGSVFRANVNVNPLNKNAVELIVLSRDNNGYVVSAPNTLKENLRKYLNRYRMMTDAIEIVDGQVINVNVTFGILTDSNYNKTDILANCILLLKEYFIITKWQLEQPINLTDITKLLASVAGVLSVYDLKVENRVGTYEGRQYNTTSYNMSENTKNGIIYCWKRAMFELKYPNKDIVGYAK